jgi:hypothetical protein
MPCKQQEPFAFRLADHSLKTPSHRIARAQVRVAVARARNSAARARRILANAHVQFFLVSLDNFVL